MKKIKLGILKETKTPIDKRVVVSPEQVIELSKKFSNLDIVVQRSEIRAFKDEEYEKLDIKLTDDLSDCDILAGVKEVAIPNLISDKTYLFFSHTAKKQPYNRPLLQEVIKKNIHLIDHEYLTDENNIRLVSFGRWAGIVGGYNAILAFGTRAKLYDIKRAFECFDLEEVFEELKKVELPPIKILVTGAGRVAGGTMEILDALDIKKVTPKEFLKEEFLEPVYCQIDPSHYTKRKNSEKGDKFDLQHFIENPEEYQNRFKAYSKVTDIFIPSHFWDQRSPIMFNEEDMKNENFKISVISDISCDIKGPIASTLRSSTIENPYYGYNPKTSLEDEPFDMKNITVIAIDNLPGELPRTASESFGKALIDHVFPALFEEDKTGIIERASITNKGKLTDRYTYLQDFIDEKE